MHRITIIGGAGNMAQVATRRLLGFYDDCRIVLADYDQGKAEKAAASFGSPRVTAAFTDIFDPGVLRESLLGSDLAINCTGSRGGITRCNRTAVATGDE